MDITPFFNKYLLDTYYAPSIVLGILDMLTNQTYKDPRLNGIYTIIFSCTSFLWLL